MKKVPVVIFGDHIAAYGAIRSLGTMDIPIYIISNTAKGISTKSRFVKKTLALSADDRNFMEKFNEWVRKEIGTEAVLMVAGVDDYLDVLAKNYGELPPCVRPTFPDWNTVKLVRQKKDTYRIAEELGIPIPKTYYITSQNEIENLLDKGIDAEFPLLMKSENSARFSKDYGTKAIICETQNKILENYIKYKGFFGSLLLQEMIPGGEELLFNLIGVFDKDAEPIAVFMNRKRRSSAQFLSCTLMESMWSEKVMSLSLKLIKGLGYVGYANPEFKYDYRDRKLKLMEINGRITMSNSHALRCGINLPLIMYNEAIDEPLPKIKKLKKTYSDNILWWFLTGDTASAISLLRKKEITAKEYIMSLMGKGYVIEPFSINDPIPGCYSILNYSYSVIKSGVKKLL